MIQQSSSIYLPLCCLSGRVNSTLPRKYTLCVVVFAQVWRFFQTSPLVHLHFRLLLWSSTPHIFRALVLFHIFHAIAMCLHSWTSSSKLSCSNYPNRLWIDGGDQGYRFYLSIGVASNHLIAFRRMNVVGWIGRDGQRRIWKGWGVCSRSSSGPKPVA